MASILNEIEDTLSAGSVYNLKLIIFEKLLKDSIYIRELREATTLRKTRPTPYGNISRGYTQFINSDIRYLALNINIYNLIDDFGFDVNDIELFCSSKYVRLVNEMSFFNAEYSLEYQSTYDKTIKFLKDNREIDSSLLKEYNFIPYNFLGDNAIIGRRLLNGSLKPTKIIKSSIRKMILGNHVVFSDLFWDELKEFVIERFNKDLENSCM